MDFEGLKEILSKSGRKMIIVGFLPLLIGLGIIAGAIVEGGVAYWVVGGIFSLIGLLMFFKGVKNNLQVKSNSHPILKAIKDKDKDFVVWVYDKRIKSQVEGIQVGQSSNLVVVYKNGKGVELMLGKNKNIEPLIAYLAEEFPKVEIGYSDESRAKMSQLLGKKY